jgi:bacterial/archaeal transporter family-2 protein
MAQFQVKYAAIMLLAGVGIPLLAALNSRLGARIASPNLAAVVLFAVALMSCVAVAAVSSGTQGLALVPAQPWHLFLGGLFVAFYVLSVTWVAPRFGLGNAIFFVLMGQMLSATTIDHFGLFGAMVKPVDVGRLVGLALMAIGVGTIQFTAR